MGRVKDDMTGEQHLDSILDFADMKFSDAQQRLETSGKAILKAIKKKDGEAAMEHYHVYDRALSDAQYALNQLRAWDFCKRELIANGTIKAVE